MQTEAGNGAATAALSTFNLRCEYAADPMGIGVRKPRLSWQIAGPGRGVRQSAYRIIVADSHKQIAQNQGNVWDTQRITSDQSIHIPYDGPPLQSRQRYYWKVQSWDVHNRPSAWSDAAFWEMGLLGKQNWHAAWISAEKSIEGGCPLFRRDFHTRPGILSARLYATALGTYELHLNGQRVGDAYFAPGWTSYHKRIQYQTYDVTAQLQAGPNALGAIVSDGWHRGHLMHYTAHTQRHRYGDKAALRLQLHITYADGTTEMIATDEQWRTAHGAIRYADHYMGETHDYRLAQAGWSLANFDDSHWQPVRPIVPAAGKLIAQIGPPVRKIDTLPPKAIFQTPAGETVIDFGQNMVGWVQLRAEGVAGTHITLRHAETLDTNGNFYTANLRRAAQTVTYILDGSGEQTLEPRFSFQGFRYVAIEGYHGVTLDQLIGVVVHSDMAKMGRFECSDAAVNQLQQNIVWSQRGNFLDLPTDCPQRDERMGWTGDAHLFLPTAAFNMDVAALFTRWLRDLVAEQRADGAFPHTAPNVLGATEAGSAGWADAGVLGPWHLYQAYGDTRILRRGFASMQRWIQYMHSRAGNNLIWRGDFQFGDWLAIERTDVGTTFGKTDDDLIATAYYAYSTSIVGKVARILAHEEAADSYDALAEQIRAAFCHEFMTHSGRLSSDTQTAYVLALAFDLLPDALRPEAARRLVADIEARGDHLSTGFLGTPHLCDVLTRFGHVDVAYRLLLQSGYPSWLYPIVAHGATTMWERWDGIRPNQTFQDAHMNSFNHYANGSIGAWLYQTVAGIQPNAPGYRTSIIAPQIGEHLTWAEASHQTMYGELACRWERNDDILTLDVTVPPNTTAMIHFPTHIVIEGDGPLTPGNGIYRTFEIDGKVRASVGSGQYRFEALLA